MSDQKLNNKFFNALWHYLKDPLWIHLYHESRLELQWDLKDNPYEQLCDNLMIQLENQLKWQLMNKLKEEFE